MGPVIWLLSPVTALTAGLHIHAEYHGPRVRTYLFKPLTTALILLIALFSPGPVDPTYRVLIVAGLAFSLAGDVFLMLPADRFLVGLVSFLIAHLLYTAAFTVDVGFAASFWVAVPLFLYGLLFLRFLWPFLNRMKWPATLYMLAILLMAWTATGRWLALRETGAFMAAAGALLFVFSDSVLALNRFRRPFPSTQLLVLGSYYLAQWLIALSVGRRVCWLVRLDSLLTNLTNYPT